MKYKTIPFIFFLLLLVIPLGMAKQPTIVSGDFAAGYTLEAPIFEAVKVNASYSFHIHVYNTSNGQPVINGIGCYFHLYNESGTHLIKVEDYTIENTFDYEFKVYGNLSMPGFYSALISCNNSHQGGFLQLEIPVTYSGYQTETSHAIQDSFATLIFIIIMFGVMFLFISVGKAIPVEDWATFALKILCYCLALAMVFIPIGFLNKLITLAKDTMPSHTLTTGAGLNLYNSAFSSVKVAVLAVAAFGFIYVVYLVYQALLSNANRNSKGFGRGGSE